MEESSPLPTEMASWLECHAEKKLLVVHEAAKHRINTRGHNPTMPTRRRLTKVLDSSLLPENCPFDNYLGLRFYHQDPLRGIRQLCERRQRTSASVVKFTDQEFPIHETSTIIHPSNVEDFKAHPGKGKRAQFYLNRSKHWRWVRGSEMKSCALFSLPSTINASISPSNVVQGGIGNCGVCSGLASLAAAFPDFIERAFGEGSSDCLAECGFVTVRVYPRGQERYIVVDDFLLCKTANDCCSPSMHSSRHNELWIRLLEKALCKIQGSYASLDGLYKYGSLYRHPARALQLLTGASVAFELRYGQPVDMESVFSVLSMTQGKYVRVVHCRKALQGLHASHGYSLLWVGDALAGATRLVCLRNPHGLGSYRGKFGFGSSVWSTRKGKQIKEHLLSLPFFDQCVESGRVVWHTAAPTRRQNEDDGVFFMEFSTFVECFPIATIVGPMKMGSANRPTVPDCVYSVPKSHLFHVPQLLAAAEV